MVQPKKEVSFEKGRGDSGVEKAGKEEGSEPTRIAFRAKMVKHTCKYRDRKKGIAKVKEGKGGGSKAVSPLSLHHRGDNPRLRKKRTSQRKSRTRRNPAGSAGGTSITVCVKARCEASKRREEKGKKKTGGGTGSVKEKEKARNDFYSPDVPKSKATSAFRVPLVRQKKGGGRVNEKKKGAPSDLQPHCTFLAGSSRPKRKRKPRGEEERGGQDPISTTLLQSPHEKESTAIQNNESLRRVRRKTERTDRALAKGAKADVEGSSLVC